jgi:peptidase E
MSLLAASHAVLIAGGHIAVLLNRLRLFDLSAVLRERPVFGWSAGAMVLTSRIVLFHDSPPRGGATRRSLSLASA